jgi:hypothetical protein
MRDDILAGIIGWQRRLKRERDDAAYLASRQGITLVGNHEALENESTAYAGIGMVARDLGVTAWDGDTCDIGIGSRLDLDHPLPPLLRQHLCRLRRLRLRAAASAAGAAGGGVAVHLVRRAPGT